MFALKQGEKCQENIPGYEYRVIFILPFFLHSLFVLIYYSPICYKVFVESDLEDFSKCIVFYVFPLFMNQTLLLLFHCLIYLPLPNVISMIAKSYRPIVFASMGSVVELIIMWCKVGVNNPLNPWLFKFPEFSR